MFDDEKDRYLLVSASAARFAAVRASFWQLAGTIPGTILGTGGLSATQSLSYTGSRRGEVAERLKAAVC
jgi:hypothetical protein